MPDRERIPEPPAEAPVSGAPYWYWLGGRPALDLVNTLRERWDRRLECLAGDDDVIAWLVEAQLMPAPLPAPAGIVAEARVLREAIDACVMAVVDGVPVPDAAVAVIDDWLVIAGARPQLRIGAAGEPVLDERAPADSPRRALGLVALDAARMLGDPAERARIRVCAADDCSARFYDRSPAAARRWCSMTACGNVAKARRHRARGRTAA